MLKTVEVGILSLPEGRVDITDPCYKRSTWCRINALPVRIGNYRCFTDEYREPGEPEDIYPYTAGTCIIHEDFAERLADKDPNLVWLHYDNIGVDAGLAGYFPDKPDFSTYEWDAFCDLIHEAEKSNHAASINKYGFVSRTGYGDGGYPVEVLVEINDWEDKENEDAIIKDIRNNHRAVLGVRLTFMDPGETE